MSWRKGDLGKMANVMLGGAKLSPVWPWQRDALAAALRECRRKAIERGASADAAAQMCDQTRRLFLKVQESDETGAGGVRRVLVRACARLLGVSETDFILGAIGDAVALLAARADGVPMTRRELCALAAAEINGAVTGRDYAGTLAGLVRGGAK